MELMEAMQSRRAVRAYTPAPVNRETVEELIGAAILAPSAMNLQPWTFAVLLDRDRIRGYGQRITDWLKENMPDEKTLQHLIGDPGFEVFCQAPALVLVLAASHESQAMESQAREDCCLAAQNLMLAARDRGIASCWIGLARPWLNLPASKLELGLPDRETVVAPIVLGYPKAWPASPGRKPALIQWLK